MTEKSIFRRSVSEILKRIDLPQLSARRITCNEIFLAKMIISVYILRISLYSDEGYSPAVQILVGGEAQIMKNLLKEFFDG